ncbi:MAG TPA: M56 family metallopeptidase, partial [Terracidiphilus sp.]
MTTPDLIAAARFAGNHLWQSTLVACAAGALVMLLRSSEARLRHAIWMAASLKFLVPFSLLVAVGAQLATRRVGQTPEAPLVTTVLQIGQPFAAGMTMHANPASRFPWALALGLLWAAGTVVTLTTWTVRWLRVRTLARKASVRQSGREADALRTAQASACSSDPIPLLISDECMEPGIFGIVHPVLLWPQGISEHLDDRQLAAIVAHEVCHVQRRDNLFALLQMCVQAAFWFHPLVWWMGTRLLEERERACDEAVLRLGNEPAHYADAILKACRFCVESPLTCISGVSGSDLKRRMVRIMNAATVPLSRSRKMLLASVAVATIAGPIAMGALHPRVVKADEAQDSKYASLRFDNATLTPAQSTAKAFFVMQDEGEFRHDNITMKDLIAMAYGVKPERIVGGPDWLATQRFNFDAHWTPTHEDPSKVPGPGTLRTESKIAILSDGGGGHGHDVVLMQASAPASLQAMLRNFLADRVSLRVRNDSAVLPVYELVVANGGSRLTPAHQEQPSSGESQVKMKARIEADGEGGNMFYSITNGDAHMLCENLTNQLGHQVFDKTGLTGRYDFEIAFPAHADPDQIAAALRDRYGLDLQSTQQPV